MGMLGIFTRAALVAGMAITATHALAQQGPRPSMSTEERIGKAVGPIIVRAALLEAANEELRGIVEQRDKTIADLQAQIAALKKEAPQ